MDTTVGIQMQRPIIFASLASLAENKLSLTKHPGQNGEVTSINEATNPFQCLLRTQRKNFQA